MGWEKIADIFAWLVKKLPIPDRVEGLKNEIDKLQREKSEILIHKADVKKANRIKFIDARIDLLRCRLRDLAKD